MQWRSLLLSLSWEKFGAKLNFKKNYSEKVSFRRPRDDECLQVKISSKKSENSKTVCPIKFQSTERERTDAYVRLKEAV